MSRQLVSIQYLRALSACAIVLFHSGLHWHVFIPIGEGRVALFFIVSGFIFWWITTGKRADGGEFMLRRIARLAPLYWLVTILTALISWVGLSSHQPIGASHLIQSLLFIPHGGPLEEKPFPVVFPGWTLIYEFLFCILFSLLLYIKESARIWVATALFGGLALIGFIFHPRGVIAATYTNEIMLEFLAGVWIGWLWPRRPEQMWVYPAGLIVGLIASFGFVPLHDIGPELLISALPAWLIVVGALGLETHGIPKIGWLKRVGDSSYSIYLWHIPALNLAVLVTSKLHITSLPALIMIGTSFGIGSGLILYPILERPMTEALMKAIDARVKAKRALRAKIQAPVSQTGQEASA